MSTGLDSFDKTVQESNLWLKDVMERLNTYDRHRAYSALRAVLHALRGRTGPQLQAGSRLSQQDGHNSDCHQAKNC